VRLQGAADQAGSKQTGDSRDRDKGGAAGVADNDAGPSRAWRCGSDWHVGIVVGGTGSSAYIVSAIDAQYGVSGSYRISWYTIPGSGLNYVGAVRVP
jgi:hypothetical protein